MLPATLRYWMTRLRHVRFTALYGFSEATMVAAYYTVPAMLGDDVSPLPVGLPLPNQEILVLDDRLAPVDVDQVGDVYIRGVGVSPGYWRNAEATESAFRVYSSGSDRSDRVFRTGDLGRRGADGHVYIVGRREMTSVPASRVGAVGSAAES